MVSLLSYMRVIIDFFFNIKIKRIHYMNRIRLRFSFYSQTLLILLLFILSSLSISFMFCETSLYLILFVLPFNLRPQAYLILNHNNSALTSTFPTPFHLLGNAPGPPPVFSSLSVPPSGTTYTVASYMLEQRILEGLQRRYSFNSVFASQVPYS